MSTQHDHQHTTPTPVTSPGRAGSTGGPGRTVASRWDEVWLERRTSKREVVLTWIGWHFLELVGVGLPVILALTISWWLVFIALVVGGLWVGHEARVSRRHKTMLAAIPGPRTADAASDGEASDSSDGSGTDEDESGKDVTE